MKPIRLAAFNGHGGKVADPHSPPLRGGGGGLFWVPVPHPHPSLQRPLPPTCQEGCLYSLLYHLNLLRLFPPFLP